MIASALAHIYFKILHSFEGGMTAKKYRSINKTSKSTATRDLQHLSEIGAFTEHGGGRSVYYVLNMEPYNHLF